MKRTYIELSEEDYEMLVQLAQDIDTTPSKLLQAFARDLTYSDYSQGSDEREFARQWYYRSMPNF